MGFVNALALSGLETLKHLQKVFVNFTVVNALARAKWKPIILKPKHPDLSAKLSFVRIDAADVRLPCYIQRM